MFSRERVELMDKISKNGEDGGKLFWNHWKKCSKEEGGNSFRIEENGKLTSDMGTIKNNLNRHFKELNLPHEIGKEGREGVGLERVVEDRGIIEEEISIEETHTAYIYHLNSTQYSLSKPQEPLSQYSIYHINI